ncbi:MAG: TraR/DksA C4-type zinc finger protein [Sphingomonadales bacterium]
MVQDLEAAAKALTQALDELDQLDAASHDARAPVALDQQSVGRLSRMDAMQVQAMSLAAKQRRAQQRQRIEAALQRIEQGDYGYCVRCGASIAAERLKADPTAPFCRACVAS